MIDIGKLDLKRSTSLYKSRKLNFKTLESLIYFLKFLLFLIQLFFMKFKNCLYIVCWNKPNEYGKEQQKHTNICAFIPQCYTSYMKQESDKNFWPIIQMEGAIQTLFLHYFFDTAHFQEVFFRITFEAKFTFTKRLV